MIAEAAGRPEAVWSVVPAARAQVPEFSSSVSSCMPVDRYEKAQNIADVAGSTSQTMRRSGSHPPDQIRSPVHQQDCACQCGVPVPLPLEALLSRHCQDTSSTCCLPAVLRTLHCIAAAAHGATATSCCVSALLLMVLGSQP